MKKIIFLLFSHFLFAEIEIPFLEVKDTINPGTADYITQNIKKYQGSPFIVIQLDTPGGLLNSTRAIIQEMLNSKAKVIVWISPKGSRASSAGALITLASDIAVMSTGTHMGAAHPVNISGGEKDKILNEKIENDTAAYAESIAKAKKRNAEWAINAVKRSESLSSDVALRQQIIDYISDSEEDLLKKVIESKKIADGKYILKKVSPSIKQKLVSFFSDPNISYFLLSAAGLCLWLELSNPGLILPAVVGAICLVISLISLQTLPIHYGALGLILIGLCFIAAEFFITSGLLAIGGILSFFLGSLFLMDTNVPEFQLSLYIIVPISVFLFVCASFLSYLVVKSKTLKPQVGLDSNVGEYCEVVEATDDEKGKVMLQGELWNARSSTPLKPGDIGVVKKIEHMIVMVEPKHDKEPI
jgi:membrane-bound serine protease (ClpP class)